MLNITDPNRARSDSSNPVVKSRVRVKTQPSQGTPKAPKNDQVNLTKGAKSTKPTNPYAGIAPSHTKVKVDAWGTGENDSLYSILKGQNYSRAEIFGEDKDGLSLLDRVSRANKLKDPNLIRAGQELVIPSKEKPAQKGGATAQVKVGKWGRDKSGSLFGILSSQGFSREQILKRDSQGDSLLNKVARANGLSDPNKIREGAKLTVPTSLEGLESMDVPALQKKAKKLELPIKRVKLEALKPIEKQPAVVLNPKAEIPKTPKLEGEKKASPVVTNTASTERVTTNMGMLLNGVKEGRFKKEEFQYLNSLSNRYEETRAKFSQDGFTNAELKALGKFETSYGVTYTRLYNTDAVKLTNGTKNATTPAAKVRLKHYEEGGKLWENFQNGSVNTEQAIETLARQRTEARAQGEK